MNQPADNLRTLNMQKRRARILTETRRLLTQGGVDAVNLRDLARLADVTVPTIYNLIGSKEEVLVALFSEVLSEIESRMVLARSTDPFVMAEAVVRESTSLFAEDEDFYRSAFLAVEYLDQRGAERDEVAQLYAWGERLTTTGVIACRQAGLLRGRIAPARLGELILRSYRTSCRAWAMGQITLTEFRARALNDVYITLAADAVETFRALLEKKIAAPVAMKSTVRTERTRIKE
jgi:AcrR family transcriptional regulator